MEFIVDNWEVIALGAGFVLSEIVGLSKLESNSVISLIKRLVMRK